eukprot:s175_g3.t1
MFIDFPLPCLITREYSVFQPSADDPPISAAAGAPAACWRQMTDATSLNPLLENGSPAAEHSPGTSRPGTARGVANQQPRVHFPDEPDADGNPCMRGIDRCDEALGGGAAANWQQVGAGRGSYEVVETLVYVGEGKGNYNKEEVEPVKLAPPVKITWQRKLYMSILCSLLLAGAISLTVSLILGPKTQALRPPMKQAGHLPTRDRRSSATFEELKVARCHQDSSKWSSEDRQFCCSQLGLGCPDLKCKSGRDDWQHAWSAGKKIWCCKHHHVGCGPDDAKSSAVSASAGHRSSEEERPRVVPVPVPVPAPPAPAPPAPAPEVHHGFWRPMAAVPAAGHAVPAKAPVPAAPGAPAAPVVHEPFKCNGEAKGWPDKQQEWCCWHYGTGCPR